MTTTCNQHQTEQKAHQESDCKVTVETCFVAFRRFSLLFFLQSHRSIQMTSKNGTLSSVTSNDCHQNSVNDHRPSSTPVCAAVLSASTTLSSFILLSSTWTKNTVKMSDNHSKPDTKRFKALVRKKKIEKGLRVSPTPSELARDNIAEDDATIIHNLFGTMITLHPGNIIKKSGRGVCLGEAEKGWAACAQDIFAETYPDELVDYIALSRYQQP